MFEPLSALSWEERIQVVTLPSTIGRLKAVKKLVLEASNLVRLPAAIGAMTCLEDLDLYQSYRLHWVPYEITRCPLRSSRVSTRALYGNPKVNAPFPRLQAATTDAKAGLHLRTLDPAASQREACSVCGAPLSKTELRQVWVTMRVATDMLPLLVNACSESCIRTLPRPSHQDVCGDSSAGVHESVHRGGELHARHDGAPTSWHARAASSLLDTAIRRWTFIG